MTIGRQIIELAIPTALKLIPMLSVLIFWLVIAPFTPKACYLVYVFHATLA